MKTQEPDTQVINRLPSQMTEKKPECSYFTISHSISIVHNAYYLKATVFGSSLHMFQNIFQIFEILENLKYLKIEIFPNPGKQQYF
jgi:hypothetical protein